MGQRKLEVKCLCKSFGDNTVLQKIDFYVDVSEFVAVMGQSGCGKSTLGKNQSQRSRNLSNF